MHLKILLAALVAANFAHASSFNISPIRAELGGVHHTEVMTLTNADDSPVVVEVRVVKWSQDNGADQLDDTRELLVTPPVLQIPGKGEQIIRVALRREPDSTRETTYRVIFQEVPQAASAEFTGLRVALRLSVPVFVAPARGRAQADVSWDAHWLPTGELEVGATNNGKGHLQVIDFDLQLPGASAVLRGITAKYLLPGSRMVWTLSPPADAQKDGAISIHGHSDQGEFSADVANNGS